MASKEDLQDISDMLPLEVILSTDEEEEQRPSLPEVYQEAIEKVKFFASSSRSMPASADQQAQYLACLQLVAPLLPLPIYMYSLPGIPQQPYLPLLPFVSPFIDPVSPSKVPVDLPARTSVDLFVLSARAQGILGKAAKKKSMKSKNYNGDALPKQAQQGKVQRGVKRRRSEA